MYYYIFSMARIWEVHSGFWRPFHRIQYIWKINVNWFSTQWVSFRLVHFQCSYSGEHRVSLIYKDGLSPIKWTITIYLFQNPEIWGQTHLLWTAIFSHFKKSKSFEKCGNTRNERNKKIIKCLALIRVSISVSNH